jgi:hypothetical protein
MEVTPRLVCPQSPLDDVERDALVGELDGVGVAQLVWREALPHAGLGGDAPQLGAGGVGSPRPATRAPLDNAQSGPTGIPIRS